MPTESSINNNTNKPEPEQLELFPDSKPKKEDNSKDLDKMVHTTDEDITFCRIYNIDWNSIL